jgi:EAL domain-containing protein (putative c-di-GMP-specific phosphodiesterase class I)
MFAAVLGVARAAELQAVAEGIEAPPQLQLLRRLGCEIGQGFIFAHPVSAEEVLELLEVANGGGLVEGSAAAA